MLHSQLLFIKLSQYRFAQILLASLKSFAYNKSLIIVFEINTPFDTQLVYYIFKYQNQKSNQRNFKLKMATVYPKKLNGLCVGILSGDRVLFQGPPDKVNGGHKQKILHLSAISAPKVDTTNGRDQKYGFAAREFLRKRILGKDVQFVVQKKVNEIQLGYVLYEGKDLSVELLARGYARLRGQKINAQNIENYKDAQEEARMSESGIWSSEGQKAQGAYRYINNELTEKDILERYKASAAKVIIQEIHPSKAVVYFIKDGMLATVNFSQVQVVVLSQKLENGESRSNVRLIRGILESYFLQRQVDLYLAPNSLNQGLSGHIINQQGKDVRKVLLENGFAKLSKDAMNNISTKQFMQLKSVAQGALNDGKGLWKQQKIQKSEVINSKSYTAPVIQVHSGDSLSVMNPKRQIVRIYLPNIRAPSNSQPWAFESKEALRRRCIGTIVRVQTEFSKNINVKKFEGDIGEMKKFTFASVFQNNQNLSVYMLENGFVTIQQIRVEEDMTKYLEDLRTAEQKAKKQKKGIHKSQSAKIPNFNDLSGGKGKKIDAAKCKNIFPFLAQDEHVTGVIDLVLNGSRFKIRFNHQHVMAIMVLDGVRCLPNEGPYQKISEQALIFSKQKAQQRDVEIELRRVDQKGIFHGKMYINKKDYAIDLLQAGLAIYLDRSKNAKYQEAQNFAKKHKHGLWKYNLNLTALKGQSTEKEFREVNFFKNLILLEVVSAQEFYLQPIGCVKPEVPQNPESVGNVNIGEIYSAEFSDGVYYRAKILRENKGKYEVHFIDYGNYFAVDKKKIGVISDKLRKQKVQIYRGGLYGVEGLTPQASNILKDYLDAQLKVQFKQQAEDGQCKVILNDKELCINQVILEQGEGQCTTTNEKWQKAEEKAKVGRFGKWSDE